VANVDQSGPYDPEDAVFDTSEWGEPMDQVEGETGAVEEGLDVIRVLDGPLVGVEEEVGAGGQEVPNGQAVGSLRATATPSAVQAQALDMDLTVNADNVVEELSAADLHNHPAVKTLVELNKGLTVQNKALKELVHDVVRSEEGKTLELQELKMAGAREIAAGLVPNLRRLYDSQGKALMDHMDKSELALMTEMSSLHEAMQGVMAATTAVMPVLMTVSKAIAPQSPGLPPSTPSFPVTAPAPVQLPNIPSKPLSGAPRTGVYQPNRLSFSQKQQGSSGQVQQDRGRYGQVQGPQQQKGGHGVRQQGSAPQVPPQVVVEAQVHQQDVPGDQKAKGLQGQGKVHRSQGTTARERSAGRGGQRPSQWDHQLNAHGQGAAQHAGLEQGPPQQASLRQEGVQQAGQGQGGGHQAGQGQGDVQQQLFNAMRAAQALMGSYSRGGSRFAADPNLDSKRRRRE
jgi:hypothetical protein